MIVGDNPSFIHIFVGKQTQLCCMSTLSPWNVSYIKKACRSIYSAYVMCLPQFVLCE